MAALPAPGGGARGAPGPAAAISDAGSEGAPGGRWGAALLQLIFGILFGDFPKTPPEMNDFGLFWEGAPSANPSKHGNPRTRPLPKAALPQ